MHDVTQNTVQYNMFNGLIHHKKVLNVKSKVFNGPIHLKFEGPIYHSLNAQCTNSPFH